MAQINSVVNAVRILQLFGRDEPWLALGEISRQMGLGKSTTHNLLNTLVACKLVEKDNEGRYALGTQIIALTQGVRINIELRDLAAPLLRRLAETAKESVYLAVLDETHALYIYAIESSDRLRARTAVGDRAMLHCTSVGKAMLSALPAAQLEQIVTAVGLPAYTANTITNLDALRQELAVTAQRGYSIDCSEHEADYYCIGAPIFDRRGQGIAACSVSGTDPTIVGRRLDEIAAQVVHTAQEISRYMGFVPPRRSALAPLPTFSLSGDGPT
jgi:IclR family transcriptional regulator, acetate operon repressor